MAIESFEVEYRQHNRPITADQMNTYGKLATHDIYVTCLLLYELGVIEDGNGKPVDINKAYINAICEATNNYIKKKHLLPFGKFISSWSKPLDEVNAISLIKDHDLSDVDNTVGHTIGLCYTDTILDDNTGKEVYALFIDTVIVRTLAKQDVVDRLLRATSLQTRKDGSIREISFVINEAAPLCGLMLSEQKNYDKQIIQPTKIIEQDLKIQMAEEIGELKFAEHELETKIIPNHIILSRMIKKGKLVPWRYDELIKQATPDTLKLMETSIPCFDLGVIYGTNKQPEKININELKFNEAIDNLKKKHTKGKQDNKKEPAIVVDLIRNSNDFEKSRQQELKQILELAESSPENVANYIKFELGEEVDKPEYSDILLSEYVGELKEIRSKIIQLQER